MKRWRVVAVAAVVASAVGGCMSYIAGDHNAQGEFNNAAGELSVWLLFTRIFVWYFIPVFLVALTIGWAVASGLDAERPKAP